MVPRVLRIINDSSIENACCAHVALVEPKPDDARLARLNLPPLLFTRVPCDLAIENYLF